MRAVNFRVESSIYFAVDDLCFDLHNDYDFVGFSFDVAARRLALSWKLGSGEWVKAGQARALRLEIDGVTRIEVKPRDPELPFSEDNCLAALGYIRDEACGQEGFWDDAAPEPAWPWVFSFQSGLVIIVGADTAQLHTGGDSPTGACR